MKRLLALGVLLAPSVVAAHIHMTFPLSRTDLPTGDQKAQHCGLAGYSRAANPTRVSTFLPGETITVTWAETINHSGWYRIAFQPNGEVFGIPPASNGPNGAGGASNYPTASQVGVDPVNQSIVLVDRIADAKRSQVITLPNMECSNCTLQFIQVMSDAATYAGEPNLYFNCADITLAAAGAPDAGPQPVTDASVPGSPDAPGVNPVGTGEITGGCSTGSGSVGFALAVAFFGLRRRRRVA